MIFVELRFNYVCITCYMVNIYIYIYYYLCVLKITHDKYKLFSGALFNNK